MERNHHTVSTERIQRNIKMRNRARRYNQKRLWKGWILSEVKRLTSKLNNIDSEFTRLRLMEKHFKKKEEG